MFEKKKDSDPSDTHGNVSSAQHSAASTASTVRQTGSIATIGSSIHIHGEVSGNENLIVHGKIEGNIDLKTNDVTIGQSGQVVANVHASVITIEGEIVGDISGKEKVVISKTGKVRGNIVAPRVTLEDGAKFKGSIDMDPDERNTQGSGVPARAKATGELKTGGSNTAGNIN